MSKPTFKYDIRRTVLDGQPYTYPAIVERDAPLELKDVVKNAIDQGRIVGLKGTAAESIEYAVLTQIYAELQAGNTVKFEDFFSIMLFLEGQTDANGTLTGDNTIAARFINGKDLGITRDTFKFEYADDGETPNVMKFESAVDGTEKWTVEGANDILVMGTHITSDDPTDGYEVILTPVNGGESIVVTEFATKSSDILRFARPDGLAAGAYKAVVRRIDHDTSKVYPSMGRNVTVKDTVPPPVTDPEFTKVTMGEFPDNEVDFDDHTPLVFHGTNLAYNAAAGDTLKIELRPDKGAATAVLDELKSISASADGTTLSCINEVNTSGKPDGSWWGRDALVTLTTGGKTATLWVKFHDWN